MENAISSTVTWEGRIEIRRAAEIVRFFEKNHIAVQSRSELVGRVFNEMADLVVSNGIVERVGSDEDAILIIARANLPIQTGRKKATVLINNLAGKNTLDMRKLSRGERERISTLINAEVAQQTPEYKAGYEEMMSHKAEFEAAYGHTYMEQPLPTPEQQKHIDEAVAAIRQQQVSNDDPTAEEIEQFKKEQEEQEQQEVKGQDEFVKALKGKKIGGKIE